MRSCIPAHVHQYSLDLASGHPSYSLAMRVLSVLQRTQDLRTQDLGTQDLTAHNQHAQGVA